VARFAEGLYADAAGGKRFFLDKTPRYHLVVDELLEVFPEAPVVFLWRNPLAIAASIIETWGSGRWVLDVYSIDLFEGLERLTNAYERQRKRAVAIRYEDLVQDPDDVARQLLESVGLTPVPGMTARFSDVRLRGTMGDPTGTHRYQSISLEPLARWRQSLANPVRKIWAKRYLNWIGERRLALMGYDLEELLTELEMIPASRRYLASDAARRMYGHAARRTARALLAKPRGNSLHHIRPAA
jgi:hypothetical protein